MFFLSRCGLSRSFCMLIFAELLDLLFEHNYLVFFTKHAEYFKNIFSRSLMQQQLCLKDFRNHRAQVASCMFPLPLIFFFFLLWAWSNALAMNLHVNKNCVFGLLSRNSEEGLAFASAVTDFGDNWHWSSAVCLSASESLTLIFTEAGFCSFVFDHSPVSVLLR